MRLVRHAGDTYVRPVGSDRRVDRAGPMENACDTLCSHSIVVANAFSTGPWTAQNAAHTLHTRTRCRLSTYDPTGTSPITRYYSDGGVSLTKRRSAPTSAPLRRNP